MWIIKSVTTIAQLDYRTFSSSCNVVDIQLSQELV
jgi:hypothetical protein